MSEDEIAGGDACPPNGPSRNTGSEFVHDLRQVDEAMKKNTRVIGWYTSRRRC
jgi:hypothetical protein